MAVRQTPSGPQSYIPQYQGPVRPSTDEGAFRRTGVSRPGGSSQPIQKPKTYKATTGETFKSQTELDSFLRARQIEQSQAAIQKAKDLRERRQSTVAGGSGVTTSQYTPQQYSQAETQQPNKLYGGGAVTAADTSYRSYIRGRNPFTSTVSYAVEKARGKFGKYEDCLLYTSPSPRDRS